MSILVAGGAGYIGAHVVRLLLERGEEVVVVDDLSYGTPERVKGASLLELDVARACAGADLVIGAVLVPGAGHQVRRSDPQAFYRAVDAWLAKVLPVD